MFTSLASPSSPMKTVTTELLREIFLLAGQDDEHSRDRLRDLGANTAWFISRVCRRWKDVVAQTSLNAVVHTDKAHVSIVRQERMLSITFNSLDGKLIPSDGVRLGFKDVLLAMLPNTDRWKSLIVVVEPSFFAHLRPLEGRIGSLQSLNLQSVKRFSRSDYLHLAGLTIFSTLPRLTTLAGSPRLLLALELPLNQITNLETLLDCPSSSIPETHRVLQRTPGLKDCSLACEHDDEDFEEDTLEHLTLPNVTTLSISLYGYGVMKFLSFPALETCNFETSPTNDPVVLSLADCIIQHEIIVQLLSRSGNTSEGIKRLRIAVDSDSEMMELDWVAVLNSVPKVESLELVRSGVDLDCFLEQLFERIITTPSRDFLPAMHVMVLQLEWMMSTQLADYLDWVEKLKKGRPSVNFGITVVE